MIDELEAVDKQLRLFIYYCQSLPILWEDAKQAEDDYYSGALKAPPIKSSEEAKYKKSTSCPIDRMAEMIQRKDDLMAEYKHRADFCRQIQEKLMELSNDEIELLYWRYEREFSLRLIGQMYFTNKDTVKARIDKILQKIRHVY